MNGDAYRYAENLHDPAAQRSLVQAALTALLTIQAANKRANDPMPGPYDWARVEAELGRALGRAGHPAGDAYT